MADQQPERKARILNRTYLVNKRLQLTIILYSLILALLVSSINFGFHYFLIHQPPNMSNLYLLILFLIVLLVIYLVSIFAGVILTNRFAGPIFRLKSHMDSVAEGKSLEPMGFRKNDYFLELILPYNKILALLNEKNKK